MKNSELLQAQLGVENTENNSKSISENTELNNEPIINGLMIARELNQKWFATIGKYRVTPQYESKNDLLAALAEKQPDWETLSFLIAAMEDSTSIRLAAMQKQIDEIKAN